MTKCWIHFLVTTLLVVAMMAIDVKSVVEEVIDRQQIMMDFESRGLNHSNAIIQGESLIRKLVIEPCRLLVSQM